MRESLSRRTAVSVVSLFALAAALPSAAAEPLGKGDVVYESGFEGAPPQVWVGGGTAVVRENVGWGGSRGLVCRKVSTNRNLLAGIPLPRLRPGMKARVEARLNASAVSNGTASVLLETGARDGSYAGGAAKVKDEPLTNGWRRIVLEHREYLATRAVRSSLEVSMTPGACGTAVLDDVRVTVLDTLTNAVGNLSYSACSAYRSTAATGTVTFAEQISIDPDRTPVGTLDARFYYTDAAGKRVSVRADRVDEFAAFLTLDVERLAPGRQEIEFELRDGEGRLLGRDAERIPFTRVAREPAYKVYIDRHGRCIVDGKPFFPLGMYWVDDFTAQRHPDRMTKYFPRYAEGPFNTVLSYQNRMSPEEMEAFWSRNIRIILSLTHYYCKMRWHANPQGLEKPEDEPVFVRRRVDEVKDHPALLAWYMADEPQDRLEPRLRARYELVKSLDPDHPQYTCHVDTQGCGRFVRCTDVMGHDSYPICHFNRDCTEEFNPDRGHVWETAMFTAAMRKHTYGLMPFWHIPQSFAWAWDGKNHPLGRFPTRLELRNMCWQMIARGSNGLVYWWYPALWRFWGTPEFEKYWDAVCYGATEIKSQIPVLVKLPGPKLVPSRPKDVLVRTWEDDGALYVLLVNIRHTTATGVLPLPFAPAVVRELVAGGVWCGKGGLEFSLPDMAVSLVKVPKPPRR